MRQDTIEYLLDIHEHADLEPLDMAKRLTLTTYPYDESNISENVRQFYKRLVETLKETGVKFIPYEEALISLPKLRIAKVAVFALGNSIKQMAKRLARRTQDENVLTWSALSNMRFGKKVRAGVSVIALGEYVTGNLPMDNTMSFRDTSIISVVDRPKETSADAPFMDHFHAAMDLFTYHMTNIAIVVDSSRWTLYNFNASHPTYKIGSPNLKQELLSGLIPKIAAPIRPPRLREFKILNEAFDPYSNKHKEFVSDLVESGTLLEKTGLYPPGKSLNSMNFRNKFYRWIGAIHLDQRNGMSYGFLARQLPPIIKAALTETEFLNLKQEPTQITEQLVKTSDNLYLKILVGKTNYYVEVPDVWVLTQRSGANKTKIDPSKDIIKMGLIKGKLVLEAPLNKEAMNKAYKPSFDTRVILAHALGNALVASLLLKLNKTSLFVDKFRKSGMAIAHWHGYVNPAQVPAGWHVYGLDNPHVSCSSPHSAIYSLDGKLKAFRRALERGEEYLGDIHIEPHHGSNINYWSLRELGNFFNSSPEVSTLGNKYLTGYQYA